MFLNYIIKDSPTANHTTVPIWLSLSPISLYGFHGFILAHACTDSRGHLNQRVSQPFLNFLTWSFVVSRVVVIISTTMGIPMQQRL